MEAARVSELAGRVSVALDRLHKLRADAEKQEQHEHLSQLLGDVSDPSKHPEPSLELEDDDPAPGGELHGVPAKDPQPENLDPRGQFLRLNETNTHALRHIGKDQAEFPTGEKPHPPVVAQPIAAGLDDE